MRNSYKIAAAILLFLCLLCRLFFQFRSGAAHNHPPFIGLNMFQHGLAVVTDIVYLPFPRCQYGREQPVEFLRL